MRVEAKLEELGLTLPEPPKLPPGVQLSFAWVRVHQDRAYIAGQGPLNPDGSIAEPLGKVGVDLSVEEGYQAARLSALTILSSLKRKLGDLDRVTAWLMVYGLVNADPDFTLTTNVINGFSDLILELYGPEVGEHARMAPGLATLPHRGGGSNKQPLALELQEPDYRRRFENPPCRQPGELRQRSTPSHLLTASLFWVIVKIVATPVGLLESKAVSAWRSFP
jgi:enamine deaminase RidA (YjgF/YER057c/UK114 family)